MSHASLTFSCKDTIGIIHAVTGVFVRHGIAIADSQTHTEGDVFFARYVWETEQCSMDGIDVDISDILRDQFGGALSLRLSCNHTARVALLCSRDLHCLNHVLGEAEQGVLPINCPCIISHLKEGEKVAQRYNIPFHHIPDTGDTATREAAITEVLKQYNPELVGLARYMKVLSSDFVGNSVYPIINVHHALLPAFKGAKPYDEAYERGVKAVGATAHFATADLDEGPIISQVWQAVSHREDVEDLKKLGRGNESLAFATALKKFAENKIILHGRRVVVF
ncbi:formyltetrahydrofolate deformylase [Candidatus Gracilibacteria bacterium]|nr:formyltetrahydrofolate deformylase [Candidatus Gracilibacteria bacterium]